MHAPSVLLLDLDDTIVADAVTVEECWEVTGRRFEGQLPTVTAGELVAEILEHSAWYWGDPDRHRRGRLDLVRARTEVVAAVVQRLGGPPELAADIAIEYSRQRDGRLRPFPGAIETLRVLRDAGLRMALITNGAGDAQRAKIERWDLAGHFECVVIEGELGVGKPDTRVYVHVLEQLRAGPRDAWMIGDNLEWDVAAPQRLGIFAIWIDRRGRGLPPESTVRPDRVITSLGALKSSVGSRQ